MASTKSPRLSEKASSRTTGPPVPSPPTGRDHAVRVSGLSPTCWSIEEVVVTAPPMPSEALQKTNRNPSNSAAVAWTTLPGVAWVLAPPMRVDDVGPDRG